MIYTDTTAEAHALQTTLHHRITVLALHIRYKDPGGPAQLGIRDWAGLKVHGDVWSSRRLGQRRLQSC